MKAAMDKHFNIKNPYQDIKRKIAKSLNTTYFIGKWNFSF